jgi:hypothetical protein
LTKKPLAGTKININKATKKGYNDLRLAAIDDGAMPYEDFNEAINNAGEETALFVHAKGDD